MRTKKARRKVNCSAMTTGKKNTIPTFTVPISIIKTAVSKDTKIADMLFPVGRSYARAFAIITCKKIPYGTISRKFPAKKFIAARKLHLKNILFLKD